MTRMVSLGRSVPLQATTEPVGEKLLTGAGDSRAPHASVRLWDGTDQDRTVGRDSAHEHSGEHVLLEQDEQADQ